MKNLIVVIILSLSLIGCSAFDGLKSIRESVVEVRSGNVLYDIKSIELSSSEITIVDHSFNTLMGFIDKWTKVPAVTDMNEFVSEYNTAKSAYRSMYAVIENHFIDYPQELQAKFIKYKKDADGIDSTVYTMIMGRDLYNASKQAVKLAIVVAGVLK